MAKPKAPKTRAEAPREHDDPAAVKAYLTALDHPLKGVVEEIRTAILGADAAITEGIKWNSASFHCEGWFATANVRAAGSVQIVLHHGAKVKADATLRRTIEDPSQLLTWLSADRAIIPFTSADEFRRKEAAFTAIIQQWAAYQRSGVRP